MRVPSGLGAVVDGGELLGRKNGRGFYLYNNGHRKPNPMAADLVTAARDADGVSAREMTDQVVLDRAILIMVNEAARCLEERVVDDAEALDMAIVMGTGFAPFRGGLLRYADERGVDLIKQRLDELAMAFGDRFRPAPLIRELASARTGFYDRN